MRGGGGREMRSVCCEHSLPLEWKMQVNEFCE